MCRALIALWGLSLLGCASGPLEAVDEKAVLEQVRDYYDAVAIEEGGRCPRPVMRGVARYQLLEHDADQIKIQVSYTYDDPTAKFKGQCRQSGQRTFTLAERADGWEVVEMSGAGSPGIRIERILRPHW